MDSEHAEGILRDVAARPQLYTSTAPAAARVLSELDAARAEVEKWKITTARAVGSTARNAMDARAELDAVVEALAQARATIAEQAAEIEQLRGHRQILSDRCLRMGVELDELRDRRRAALDAAPTRKDDR